MKITLLDPAMCCSTGICGPEVDDVLVQTAAHVKWLKSLGHEVHRHNLSNDGEAFNEYPEALAKLQQDGMDSLPYILVKGRVVMAGKYPSKAEWTQVLEEETPEDGSEGSPIQNNTSQKTTTLIGIGAAIASSNESALKHYVAAAKKYGIAIQEIAEAMNIGNEVKNTLSQELINQANALLNEMEPAATNACAPGSGCC
ncbi:arsenite efflux transporter metallochaperone ArsD [Cyclobacterium sp. SYSU L10401]|uniref:arsenite efflux transporter metallochaperone ArsD n=1 Tax=Cyclobacterium sp. SYSU L10401 TaxID=2678657 RepID=UPI0013D4150C|nr:arsenite efflux transporter metallochaperone ArsD [Cyclobacterium sp. SYSU L10401]